MIRKTDEIRRTHSGHRPIPPIETPRPASMPGVVDTVLLTGLRVVLMHQSSVPMVHLRLIVPAAGTDPHHTAHVALIAETLFAGTNRRDRDTIDTDIARIGGTVKAAIIPERRLVPGDARMAPQRLTISGKAHASQLATLLDVVMDAVTDATHCDAEVFRRRDMLIQRITRHRAEPAVLAREALQRRRYGDHPITREVPDPRDIAAVTPTEIRALHPAVVTPHDAVLVLVGDFDPIQALAEVHRAAVEWASPAIPQRLPPVPDITGGDLEMVHLPGAHQSHLRLSAQAVAHTDPDYPPVRLANYALGDGYTTRLFDVIRERYGYCYTINSTLEFIQNDDSANAVVTVSMSTATENTAAALGALRAELERLGTEPPDEAELDQARRCAIGAQRIATMSQDGLATTLCTLVNRGLVIDWPSTEHELLSQVTADDVAAAARKFFTPTQFTGVILGDADALAATVSGMDGVCTP